MTVSKFINELLLIVKNNPEVGNYECIYGADDEGNSYHKVIYSPAVMKAESLDSHYIEVKEAVKPAEGNALCIN